MFTNFIPTKLFFGAGELEKLSTIFLPGKKALIVMTCGKSIHANGILDREKLTRQESLDILKASCR